MTESQKHLKEHFLEPETRGETYVSAELKAAWKVMLDILEEFIRVCKKFGLRYSMEGGSLLGAIRHKGFIPWDDDIDVILPREDYDKLIEVLPSELPSYYFAQTSASDKGFHIPHLMIRDSRTTGIDLNHVAWGKNFNMGIRIDVLPLDGMPSSVLRFFIRKYIAFLMMSIPNKPPGLFRHPAKEKVKQAIGRWLVSLFGVGRLYDMREWPFRHFSLDKCEYCCSLTERNFWHPHSIRKTEWFKEYIEVPFEYLTVSVPKDYDAILTQQFGNWRIPVHGGAYHGTLLFNVAKDYKATLIEQFGRKPEDLE